MAITLSDLARLKSNKEKFTCLTAYDATFASTMSDAGIEVILVGDSLGMVVQGKASTVPVTIDEMVYHTQCVSNANTGALIMADMPFMGCATLELGLAYATQLMQAGAQVIKLEGGEWLTELIQILDRNGVPVCAHLGLRPQSVHKYGGYSVQGKDETSAHSLLKEAKALEDAGATLLLVECIPTGLASKLMETVSIPVIGIGAGPATDGQVLVMHDALGIHLGKPAKFVKNFLTGNASISEAFQTFVKAVKAGTFPGPEHSFK